MNNHISSDRRIIGIAGSIVAFIIALLVTYFGFMKTETVEPGYQLVIVDKPYFFGDDGVRAQPVKAGRVFLFRTSSAIPVRVTPRSISVKFDDFSSGDNILLDFESTIQFRVTNSVLLANDFGSDDWFENNVVLQYTSIVREAVKKNSMNDMMSGVKAAAAVDEEITRELISLVKVSKLPIEILGVSLGRAKPNVKVLEQMNETAAQQQRERTLVAATQAEQQRKLEQEAKADADNAYRNKMGLSSAMFVQLEQIKRYADACATSKSCVVLSGQTPVVLNTGN